MSRYHLSDARSKPTSRESSSYDRGPWIASAGTVAVTFVIATSRSAVCRSRWRTNGALIIADQVGLLGTHHEQCGLVEHGALLVEHEAVAHHARHRVDQTPGGQPVERGERVPAGEPELHQRRDVPHPHVAPHSPVLRERVAEARRPEAVHVFVEPRTKGSLPGVKRSRVDSRGK